MAHAPDDNSMLFNSYIFIFLFLPVTLVGFYLIGERGNYRASVCWLVSASLFFYAWWNPAYLGLLLCSILFNYALGVLLSTKKRNKNLKFLLVLGAVSNLCLLAYFKYYNFFIDNINWMFSSSYTIEKNIILPLAISFFTFQQIAYLVDIYRGQVQECDFLHYCLFVTFFPQLIAGPIVHHKEILPQFRKKEIYRINYKVIAIGLTIFSIGLFKKVIIADSMASYVSPVFSGAAQGVKLTFLEAWGGSIAYTLQIYFDFSGYSDMAIGLARMFGITLPLNFHSPYKAKNIIEFWRHWHMTLSRFLKDYLYIPLGGNRKGNRRRYINIMITMLIGGLWHGAGWVFIMWGALHGFYIVLNHAWYSFRNIFFPGFKKNSFWGLCVARTITFLAVVIGWVFFRADSFNEALNILRAMAGFNGISLPVNWSGVAGILPWLTEYNFHFNGAVHNNLTDWDGALTTIGIVLFIVWFAPNTQEFMRKYKPALITEYVNLGGGWRWLQWKPSIFYTLAIAVSLWFSLNNLNQALKFLYFNF